MTFGDYTGKTQVNERFLGLSSQQKLVSKVTTARVLPMSSTNVETIFRCFFKFKNSFSSKTGRGHNMQNSICTVECRDIASKLKMDVSCPLTITGQTPLNSVLMMQRSASLFAHITFID